MKNNFLTTALGLLTLIVSLNPTAAYALRQNPSYQTDQSAPATVALAQISEKEACISFEPTMPDNLPLSGVWVFDGGTPTLENITEHAKYELPLHGGGSFSASNGDMAISPDGTYLAYIDKYYAKANPNNEWSYRANQRILRVIRSSGHKLDMEFWPLDWQWIIGWTDNQTVALYTAKQEVILLKPLTGLWRKFQQPNWVGEDLSKETYHFWHWGLPEYSANLEWVITRPSYRDTFLKNVRTGKTIWQTKQYTEDTDWSTDGSALTAAEGTSIITIKDGEKLETLDMSQFGYKKVADPKLSNNQEKLVFASTDEASKKELHIFDRTKHKLAKLCDDSLKLSWWGIKPIWSPDSRFVIQSVYKTDDKYNYYYNSFDLLIDTQEMHAYPLDTPSYGRRTVWLAKP